MGNQEKALTVLKYVFEPDDYVEIRMPKDSKLLKAGLQNGLFCLWALVQPDAEKVMRKFRMSGTGYPIEEAEEDLRFVGTILAGENAFLVFHIFEVTE